MKRFLLFVLSFVMIATSAFGLLGCEDVGGGTGTTGGETTPGDTPSPEAALGADEWAAMLSDVNFTNISWTMTGDMTYTEQGSSGVVSQIQRVKVTEQKMVVDLTITQMGQTEDLVFVFEGEELAEHRKIYTGTFQSLLDERENFEYDAESKSYKLPKTVEVEMMSQGSFITVQMSNATVSVSADGKLLACNMDFSEHVVNEHTNVVVTSNLTFEFYDYGTTVIEEAAN